MKAVCAWAGVWLLCLIASLLSLIVMPVSAIFGTGGRALRLAVSHDQLGNVIAGGDEDETISARCWRCRDRAPYRWLQPAIDRAFKWLNGETEHCRKAWEAEQR